MQVEGSEHKCLYEPCDESCEEHDKRHGGRHSERSVHLLADAEEGADAEELAENDIVYEYRRNENQYVFHNVTVVL